MLQSIQMNFEQNYQKLNSEQKQAVDTIDGPVLVIAGPGTGKTQLLSLRVANILQKTDTLPQNILCLTFTESGALNMRERLTRFIGKAAYDVNIATYHAFGGDILQRFPQYFTELELQNPIDELGKHQILETIVADMSYLNPLKQTQHHLGDLMSTVSEVKRALLSSQDLQTLADENQQFISDIQPFITEALEGFTRMPSKLEKALPAFTAILQAIEKLQPERISPNVRNFKHFKSLAAIAHETLTEAITQAESLNKTKPLTDWKNHWLAKNSTNQFILKGELENRRIRALATVCDDYQTALQAKGLYDFDDMIIRAIAALETHDDLKFSLQETYQYILLDEFQDTNAAQLKLVQLLTDNPVHEGRPNVLAVGDDDQAIYAFQGAEYSNMLDFFTLYRDVAVINLTKNYRSHADVLHVAHNIAEQIDSRLHHHFDGMSKVLAAANTNVGAASHIARHEFLSDIAEADWIAKQIKILIDAGTKPSDIAILAPKHKFLEPIVPYLNALDIPVRYEKRENILEATVVRQLITMSRLIMALKDTNHNQANALWPQVLSYDFWQLPVSEIWRVSWQVDDSRGTLSWSQVLLGHDSFKHIALLFLSLAVKAETETLESLLDYLIGNTPVETHEPELTMLTSPLKTFYIDTKQASDPDTFYHTLSHLNVLRAKLREHQDAVNTTLQLADFLNFVAMYEAANQQIINTSPYAQAADAVQLMTVFKAKGLEFAHVFLPDCLDDVWGESARSVTNKLTLPPNLQPIRHAGATPDERLRLFFVAITRAKLGLYMTSHVQTFSGKQTKRLKYLDEQEQPDGTFRAVTLPVDSQTVQRSETEAINQQELELSWQTKHVSGIGDVQLKTLLDERLKTYRLSPTHLNAFLDLEHCGPQQFMLQTLLRFPQAASANTQFGNAIHATLEWLQRQLNSHGSLPSIEQAQAQFTQQLIIRKVRGTS